MTTSLIESVKVLASPDLSSRLASTLGEPVHAVSSGLNGGLGAMLLGVLGKTGDPAAMRSVFNTITDPSNDGRVLDSPSAQVGAPEGGLSSLGGQFLSNIFGGRASAVNDVLARNSGLRLASISSLMQLASPLLLAVLGRRVREGGLNAGSLTRLFEDEREGIERAAPAGVASALGLHEAGVPVDREPEVRQEVPPRERPRVYAPEEQSSGIRWLWPALVALAAIALFLGTRAKHRAPPPAPVADTTTVPRARTSGGEVAPLAAGIQQVRLPNGIVLSVPGTSAETRLVAFLNDSTRPADDTSWIVLDRIHFASNSAQLDPDALAQAKNIGEILKAYPNANVRLGGFTDATGSDDANMRLSKNRAASAEGEIEHDGIDASRVPADGFGSKNPIADNSTDDGKAQNRRVALLVIKK
jgi:OmpA-OmpF porin, OOP family